MAFQLPHLCKSLGHLASQYNLMPAYAANNTCQAGLETLKNSNPKLFEGIQKINALLLFGNFGFFVWNLGKLIHIASERFTWLNLTNIKHAESSPYRLQLAILGTMVAWVVISRLCIELINRYMNRSSPHVQTSVPDKLNFKLSWSRPFEVTWTQGIHISQIAVNVALACLTANPIFYSVNTLMEGYRLFKVSQISWLQLDRKYPDKKIHLVYGFAVLKAPDQNVYSCSTHSEKLEDLVQKIYDKTTDLTFNFEKIKIFNKIHYASIPPNDLPHCLQCEKPLPGAYYIAVAQKRNS